MSGRRPALVATAVALLIGLSLVPAPAATATPRCPDVAVVFARGTGEPPGVGKVGAAFVDALTARLADSSVAFSAVRYPATYDFLRDIPAGATDASVQVQRLAARCPDSRLVLGGFSQGAAVMDVVATAPVGGLGYRAPLPAAVVPHVAAVVVFGNPSARLGRPLTALSPTFGARTADLCLTGDPICAPGDDLGVHSRYPDSPLIGLAARWVDTQLRRDGDAR